MAVWARCIKWITEVILNSYSFSLGWKGHWYDADHLNASRASPQHSMLPYMSQAKYFRKVSGSFSILSSLDFGVSCCSYNPSNYKCFRKSHKIYGEIFVFQCPTLQTLTGQKWVKGWSQWHSLIWSRFSFSPERDAKKFNIILYIFI